MKLLDRSMLHLSLALLLVLAGWAVAFYFVVRDAVLDSIDEGLEDQVEMLRYRLEEDPTLVGVHDLGLHGFAFKPAEERSKTVYGDTLLFLPSEGEMESVRLVTKTFQYGDGYIRLQVYTSTVEEDELVERILIALMMLYVTLLLAILVVNHVVLRRLWRPFQDLLRELKTFRLGTGKRLNDVRTTISEFRELKHAADALVEHASEAYSQQRSFTENAAHELQTPLAIAINKLELLAELQGSEEERMAALGEVIALLERLTRLNRSLLLLARIESKQFTEQRIITLGPLLGQVLDEFEDLAAHRDVRLEERIVGDLELFMDPGLARILVSNLVKNAIVHNMPGGRVHVEMDENGLTISNTGDARPLDPLRIFARFHKETTSVGGTGLGLAIAKAIAIAYGLRLIYSYDGMHVIRLERE